MSTRPFYAPYIDGLRAIAVLSVVIYHLNSAWLPGGFAGVDVFFVISGFVVSTSVSSLERISLPSLGLHFYARRLVRIAPALVVCLVVTFLASALFIPSAYLSNANEQTGLSAFVGLSNFVLAKTVGDYFAPVAAFNPFTHTWSLAVEEQFYVAFPFLFFAYLRMQRWVSVVLFAALSVASLGYAMWSGRNDEAHSFYMLWGRFWELGAGVLLFQVLSVLGHSFTEQSVRSRFAILGSLLSAAVLAAGLVTARPEFAPFPACLLPVLGTLGLIGFLHGRGNGPVDWLLNLRPLRFVGKISYSLYLWHWPVFVLFRWTVGLESGYCRATALLLAAVLSVVSYYLIETPPRRSAKNFRKVGLVAAGVALIASSYAVSARIALHQPSISLSTVQRHANEWYPEPSSVKASEHSTCQLVAPFKNVGGGGLWVFSRTGCSDKVTFPHRIFVVGDSHAMAYLPMYGQFVVNTGAQVYAYSNGGCPFAALLPGTTNPTCDGYTNAAAQDLLPQVRQGDVIFLASLRLPRLISLSDPTVGEVSAQQEMFSDEAAKDRVLGEDHVIPILREMASRGARIVFEGPTPLFRSMPYQCSDWFNKNNPICQYGTSVPRSFLEKLRQPVLDSYARIGASVPGVEVWDPFPLLCPGQDCTASLDGHPLFFDGDHLSGYSDRFLLPSFTHFMIEGHAGGA